MTVKQCDKSLDQPTWKSHLNPSRHFATIHPHLQTANPPPHHKATTSAIWV